jgi:hypothetical protein
MSSDQALLCRGAPRDLGLDQGLHFREVIRAEVGRRARAGRRGRALFPLFGREPEVARTARDTTRFFPHLAERTEGLARGARVSPAALAALLASELHERWETLIGVRPGGSGAGVLIALATDREAPLFLRISQPEGGYRSLEVAVPWRAPALAGVNEHGLAVAASGVASSATSLSGCAASAVLLVQDCLQNFDSVDKAIEWCERRPAGGSASILLAGSDGALARVDLEGELRRVHRDIDGIPMGTGEPTRVASVEKACREGGPLDAESLHRILATPTGRVAVLDPKNPERIFGDPVANAG